MFILGLLLLTSSHLEKKKKKERLYIINYDKHDQIGSHWVLIYINNKKTFFFDSYGSKPRLKMRLFLKKVNNNSNFIFNTQQLQAIGSSVCGFYCIFLAFCFKKRINFYSFLNFFTQDFLTNDIIVCNVSKEYFPSLVETPCF